MAQKKLLRVLILVLVSLPAVTIATPEVQVGKEDQPWARNLAQNATGLTIDEIRQKYIELQKMLCADNRYMAFDKTSEDLPRPRPLFRVFISSSMGRELLKAYVTEAKKYNAILVFRGLPGGSWQDLSQLVTEITEGSDEGVAIQIDDEAFDHFGIKSVPGFVLGMEDREFWQESAEKAFDKVSGNISIQGALRLIAAEGDLAEAASQMLEQAGGGR